MIAFSASSASLTFGSTAPFRVRATVSTIYQCVRCSGESPFAWHYTKFNLLPNGFIQARMRNSMNWRDLETVQSTESGIWRKLNSSYRGASENKAHLHHSLIRQCDWSRERGQATHGTWQFCHPSQGEYRVIWPFRNRIAAIRIWTNCAIAYAGLGIYTFMALVEWDWSILNVKIKGKTPVCPPLALGRSFKWLTFQIQTFDHIRGTNQYKWDEACLTSSSYPFLLAHRQPVRRTD
jgi:hypothetical protein